MEPTKPAVADEPNGSRYDTAVLVGALVLVSAGMVSYYALGDHLNKVVRLLLLLGSVAGSVALVYRTALGRELWGYVQGSRTELRKVVWPTRQESLQTTLIIAVFVVIVALILWGLDSALLFGVEKLTGRGA